MTTTTNKPIRKIIGVGVTGFIATLLIWGLKVFAHVTLPGDVAAAAVGLAVTLVGYTVPPGPADGVNVTKVLASP